MAEEELPVVWLRTTADENGAYRCTLEVNDDVALFLDRAGAAAYAYNLLNAVAIAEYDAAVLAQLTSMSNQEAAVQIVVDLRKDRPEGRQYGPLQFMPGVNQHGKPFLTVHLGETVLGQWSLPDARTHALHALESVLVADLDSAYLRLLRGAVGVDENTARNTVDDLINHRPDDTSATKPGQGGPADPYRKRPPRAKPRRKRR